MLSYYTSVELPTTAQIQHDGRYLTMIKNIQIIRTICGYCTLKNSRSTILYMGKMDFEIPVRGMWRNGR